MPQAYDPQVSLLWNFSGTVLPRVWPMVFVTSGLSLALCFYFDEIRALVKQEDDPHFPINLDRRVKMIFYLYKDAEVFLSYATTFLTFILGFFNSVAYTRWWKFRELTGVVLGRTSDTVVMIASHVTEGPADKLAQTRHELCRLLLLALECHLQDAHLHSDLIDGRLVGIISPTSREFRALKQLDKARYSVVYGWFLHRLNRAVADGHIAAATVSSVHVSIQANVTLMRGACADVKMFQNQQIPMPYVHLLELLVTVYVFIAPGALVNKLLWVAPVVSGFFTLFFYGFFILGTKILLDPFEAAFEEGGPHRTAGTCVPRMPSHTPGLWSAPSWCTLARQQLALRCYSYVLLRGGGGCCSAHAVAVAVAQGGSTR
jgi:predicted membrane chloride channel (bestrophin family)